MSKTPIEIHHTNIKNEIEAILHLNGCQQRTAGYNEAKDGRELDMSDTERLEKLTYDEVMVVVNKAQIAIIDYIFSQPTGSQTMTLEQMRDTTDEDWRNEVVQYFFNTDSLMFQLHRRKELLEEEITNYERA